MAQDLDFTKRKPIPPAMPAQRITERSRERQQKGSKMTPWIWVICLLLVLGAAAFFYYQSLHPTPVSQKSTDISTNPGATTVSGSQSDDEGLVVMLYNAGAGAPAVGKTLTALEENGYKAEDLGESLFQLDQTYIWHQPQYAAEAQKIKELLKDKKVTLRQYQGTGPYKILVQLGP